jgi:TM2 domain-containing membrane protein YozV
MKCSKYFDRDAAGVCSYSGKPYCSDELVEVQGKMYGKDNLGFVMAEIKEQAQKSNQPMVFMNAGGGGGGSSSSSSAAVGGHYRSGGRKSRFVTLFLCALGIMGLCGLHRMYTGQIGVGLIQLFTLGGFFIWQLIDLLGILVRSYRDSNGELLR